jgi:type IV pilus assembly protein PilB
MWENSAATALAALLLSRGLLSRDQLAAARAFQAQRGLSLQDALVQLAFVSATTVARLLAEIFGVDYVDLDRIVIAQAVLAAVPECIARVNIIVPVSATAQLLRLATWGPGDLDTLQKLNFILNKDIQPVVSTRDQIIAAIDRHYGQSTS